MRWLRQDWSICEVSLKLLEQLERVVMALTHGERLVRLEHREVVLQLLEQLERVVMALTHGERLGGELKRFMEVTQLVCQERPVEKGLEHLRGHRLYSTVIGARRVNVALAQLEHAQIGVRLRMRRVDRDRDLEGLVG